ncbi:hypothetical protein M2160_000723 [Streptomyces sp. SAI-117]|uniref:hypothetical protein n=1 Tax=unclassified Streptomyces TaxID=2593676 RepID=UPI002475D0D0|nr:MULTISPECIES: hypothetical protein [unclassified Streptomyces]MDH6546599.1 hypothetical protein [Streptomyces sp. SAI-041]MDH6565702.1 hypothetical protein [Streptomyces sp. SAI-117]
MQKFDTPAPLTTVIDLPTAHVQVIAADRTDTTVEIRPGDQHPARPHHHPRGRHRHPRTHHTSHGRVHNSLKNTEGTAAPLTVRATTTHGDITARSL